MSDVGDLLEDHLPEARVYWRDVPAGVVVSKFLHRGRAAHVAVLPAGPAAITFEEGERAEAFAEMERLRDISHGGSQ